MATIEMQKKNNNSIFMAQNPDMAEYGDVRKNVDEDGREKRTGNQSSILSILIHLSLCFFLFSDLGFSFVGILKEHASLQVLI